MVKVTLRILYEVSQGMKIEAEVDESLSEENLKEKALDYFYFGKKPKDFKVLYEEDGINPETIDVYSIDIEFKKTEE